ncbi:MAG: UvrD-helicase domain-containing protein [Deltaproteobacteria bacterium]|nr:UvrD-helicase domain-containing protein [Deltaproteobacteria bacterium]
MEFTADLHVHSRFSRATSRKINLSSLDFWAARKGLALVGTGDATHPEWFAELQDQLVEAEEGFYRLKDELVLSEGGQTRFVLSVEISNIYKKKGQVRKNHNLILLPNLETAARFNSRLARLGNIESDGRPILGLDAKDLLEFCLEISPEIFFIPAHIWTPWFSVLGSKSGFDSIEECFEDLTGHIYALETGLSSDPAMNSRFSAIDRFILVSNSDAHSSAKLGREANLFETDFSYPAIIKAMKGQGGFKGTIEFFPEEGKYHLDGHRKCHQRLKPSETRRLKGLCPVCGKPVTLGVMYRVEELADRPPASDSEEARPEAARFFQSLIPLSEVLSEVLGSGPQTKKVSHLYNDLLAKLGPELLILREMPIEDIARAGGELLGIGIERMRKGQVRLAPGYDGEYGRVSLFDPAERKSLLGQNALFALASPEKKKKAGAPAKAASESKAEPESLFTPAKGKGGQAVLFPDDPLLDDLNPPQYEAVTHGSGPLSILAGPGTGKTLVLTRRAAWLVRENLARPEEVLGVTFTRQATGEMSSRLAWCLPFNSRIKKMPVMTFHALGARILSEFSGRQFEVLSEEAILDLAREVARGSDYSPAELLRIISLAKQNLGRPGDLENPELAQLYQRYEQALASAGGYDFDDLIAKTVALLEENPAIAKACQDRHRHVLVDEYQDVNLAQYRLTRLLVRDSSPSLTVIGDPDQAIYGFRGADAAYFKRFNEDFPGARVIRLTQNYRSTDTILKASAQVIAHNPFEGRVELFSGLSGPVRLTTVAAASPQAEAEYVAVQIEKLLGGTSHYALDTGLADSTETSDLTLKDIAVLYRLHALAGPFVEALGQAGLPLQQAGTESLHETDDMDFSVEKISLLTMHAAKGLEFEVVFIVGLEEGVLPYEPPNDRPVSLEEERRLFYVAMTRARRQLFLTRSRSRSLFGIKRQPKPSPFLEEISSQLKTQARLGRRPPPRARQLELF